MYYQTALIYSVFVVPDVAIRSKKARAADKARGDAERAAPQQPPPPRPPSWQERKRREGELVDARVDARGAEEAQKGREEEKQAGRTSPFMEPIFMSPDSSHWAFAVVRPLARYNRYN